MARLSKDHSSWRGYGLYMKYKQPQVNETVGGHKTKKNTRKWCKGKVGKQHDLIRYFWKTSYGTRTKWIRSRCKVCHKEFSGNNAKAPLLISIDEPDSRMHPIQVKVNGRIIPFTSEIVRYIQNEYEGYYCEPCEEWHYD